METPFTARYGALQKELILQSAIKIQCVLIFENSPIRRICIYQRACEQPDYSRNITRLACPRYDRRVELGQTVSVRIDNAGNTGKIGTNGDVASSECIMLDSHPVDTHVGNMIRARRKQLGLSQHALGTAIGVTFQQVQKYESGANRISASTLLRASRALQVSVDYFFEGLDTFETVEPSASQEAVTAFMRSAEGGELASVFNSLTPARRRVVLTTVKSLAALSGD